MQVLSWVWIFHGSYASSSNELDDLPVTKDPDLEVQLVTDGHIVQLIHKLNIQFISIKRPSDANI